jgi:hypothetical protein
MSNRFSALGDEKDEELETKDSESKRPSTPKTTKTLQSANNNNTQKRKQQQSSSPHKVAKAGRLTRTRHKPHGFSAKDNPRFNSDQQWFVFIKDEYYCCVDISKCGNFTGSSFGAYHIWLFTVTNNPITRLSHVETWPEEIQHLMHAEFIAHLGKLKLYLGDPVFNYSLSNT